MAVLQKLKEDEWETAVYSEDASWTIRDLVSHLISAEQSMTRLMMQIRDGGEGVPPDFDLDRWNQSRVQKAKAKQPAQLFTEMAQSREQLLAFIDSLQPEEWTKKGRHGTLQIMSIEEMCRLITDHEYGHTLDIQAALEQ